MRRSGLSLFAVCGTPLSRISRARLKFRRHRPHAIAFDEPGVRCGWQDCEIPAESTFLPAVQIDGNVRSVERADDVLVFAHVVAHASRIASGPPKSPTTGIILFFEWRSLTNLNASSLARKLLLCPLESLIVINSRYDRRIGGMPREPQKSMFTPAL